MKKPAHYHVEDFRGEICIGYLISRVFATNRHQLEALFEREDLSFTQWRVLMCLRDDHGHTSADISRELAHDKGSMTRLIDQLETRGMLRRQRNAEDRRVVFLTLTPSGRAAVDGLIPKLVDYYNALLASFSPQEVKQLTQLLTRLRGVLRDSEVIPAATKGRAA
jgi:DNA-binding MarR family transcriptional regulator